MALRVSSCASFRLKFAPRFSALGLLLDQIHVFLCKCGGASSSSLIDGAGIIALQSPRSEDSRFDYIDILALTRAFAEAWNIESLSELLNGISKNFLEELGVVVYVAKIVLDGFKKSRSPR